EETVCPLFPRTQGALRGLRAARAGFQARFAARRQARDLDEEIDHCAQLTWYMPGRRINETDGPALDRVSFEEGSQCSHREIGSQSPPVRLRDAEPEQDCLSQRVAAGDYEVSPRQNLDAIAVIVERPDRAEGADDAIVAREICRRLRFPVPGEVRGRRGRDPRPVIQHARYAA